MPNTEIKITAMVFNNETKWAYTEPKSVADLKNGEMFPLRKAVIFSVAYDELARYLCAKEKGGQMPDSEAHASVIILITDGMPTSPEWPEHLDALKQNDHFKNAHKYAIAVDTITDEARNILSEFTDNPETALNVCTAEALQTTINAVAVIA